MKARSDPALVEQFRKFSRWAGIAASAVGILAVAGWLLNIPALRGVLLPGLATMKFNSALCFVFLGTGLALLRRGVTAHTAAQALAALVILAGVVTVMEYGFNWNTGFERWFVADSDPSTPHAGRMTLFGAMAFTALGSSLLLQARDKLIRLAQGLAIFGGTVAVVTLIGFLNGIEPAVPISLYTFVTVSTSLTGGLASLGLLLANPGAGLITILTSPSAGGILARRAIPVTVLAPMLFAWLERQGEMLGYFDAPLGLALFGVSNIVAFGLLVGWIARRLRRVDTEREDALEKLSAARDELEHRITERTARLVQSNTALLASERRLSGILNTSQDAIISIDGEQRILLFNQGAEQLFGYTAHEVIGQHIELLIPERYHDAHRHYVKRFGETDLTYGLAARDRSEITGVRKGGEEFPAEASISKLELNRERIFTVVMRDVTERRKAEAEIRELTTGLENRVAERTSELAAANTQLQELDRMKNQFVDSISHELRTPLTSIKLLHNLLAKDSVKRDQYLNSLGRETGRLQYLIESLLLVSRLDGPIPYEPSLERVDLGELAEELVYDRHGAAEERGLSLIYHAGDGLMPVKADRQLMTQALSAILTNALNYTPSGGEVLVSTSAAPELSRMGVRVADTGPGINDTDLPHLFERFYRGTSPVTMAVPGTGLGLSIAKQIIDLHNGLLEFTNEGIHGQGATFTAWLPGKEDSNQ